MTDAWIITDGGAGNLRQARALARAAGMHAGEMNISLRAPWSWLSPHLPGSAGLALAGPCAARFGPPWPRLAIGCGRQAAWVTRYVHQHAQGRCFCVQILNPGASARHWDLLITPKHDEIEGDNVLSPIGSLNPVDSTWLATARADFPALADLPRPRVAVLLGGPRQGIEFDESHAQALIGGLRARHAGEGGSLLLCASPRTPAAFAQTMRQALSDLPGMAWLGGADGVNPYAGLLAWADHIVVTADSVNMLSEAAASGSPVHTVVPNALPKRLARFHAKLRHGGWLHDLDSIAPAPTQPLRETGVIAADMLKRMGGRR